MRAQGKTASGMRKQLPSRGENRDNLGDMDKYPPTGPALKVESQIKFNLDKGGPATMDACLRDGGLNDYD